LHPQRYVFFVIKLDIGVTGNRVNDWTNIDITFAFGHLKIANERDFALFQLLSAVGADDDDIGRGFIVMFEHSFDQPSVDIAAQPGLSGDNYISRAVVPLFLAASQPRTWINAQCRIKPPQQLEEFFG